MLQAGLVAFFASFDAQMPGKVCGRSLRPLRGNVRVLRLPDPMLSRPDTALRSGWCSGVEPAGCYVRVVRPLTMPICRSAFPLPPASTPRPDELVRGGGGTSYFPSYARA